MYNYIHCFLNSEEDKMLKKILSVILSFILIISVLTPFYTVSAEDTSVSSDIEEQRAEIEKKLREIDSQLEELGEQSKEKEEYLSVLDEKITYLNSQFKLAKDEVNDIERKVELLNKSIKANEEELAASAQEITELEARVETLNAEFKATYEQYRERIRAIYISGSTDSMLVFLLESSGIQNFLTRLQMVKAVSKNDAELLKSVENQTDEIVNARNDLEAKQKELAESTKQYEENSKRLVIEEAELAEKQEELKKQQAALEEQQLEANELLQALNDKTKEYGEYRNITQAELDAIDDEIAAAAAKYAEEAAKKAAEEASKKAAKEASKKAEEEASRKAAEEETTQEEDATTTTTTTTEASDDGSYISLTYPCPAYTTVTCAFGAYAGHSGCDFSTKGNENQRIVAAESGTVILVVYKETSYGHYVVIMHDKLTPSGKVVYTLYAHNNDIIVSEGDYVQKGQQIAYSGTTGNSTGPHCHFEVRVGGSSQGYAVNPEYYLP